MRVGILVDSACDLPRSFVKQYGVEILPLSLRFGSEIFEDTREPEATQQFYERFVADKALEAESIPFGAPQLIRLIEERLVLKYDRLLVLTIGANRSSLFDNVTQASYGVIKNQRQQRREAGIEGVFVLRVIDTGAAYAGEAVLAREAVRTLIEEAEPLERVRPKLEELRKHLYTYVVSDDLFFPYHRGRKKGDRSVGAVSYYLGRLFDIKPVLELYQGTSTRVLTALGFDKALDGLFDLARGAILKGLRTPVVCMSYAGNPADILKRSSYQEFTKYVEAHEIEIMLAIMSASAGVDLGPGAFSLAFLGD